MTRLAQLLHYTSLSQALFSKPLSPIGPTQPSRGECDQENSPLSLPRWTPCLFLFIFLFFLVCFLSYFPMLSTLYCLYLEKKKKKTTTVLLISSVVFYICYFGLLFWLLSNPHPPLSFLLQLRLVCDWILSRLLRHTGGMCITHGMLGGWSLTPFTLLSPSPVELVRGLTLYKSETQYLKKKKKDKVYLIWR